MVYHGGRLHDVKFRTVMHACKKHTDFEFDSFESSMPIEVGKPREALERVEHCYFPRCLRMASWSFVIEIPMTVETKK